MKPIGLLAILVTAVSAFAVDDDSLTWTELSPIPDELGLAGPFTGIHEETLLVAGGANFPKPVWESDKQWHSVIYGLPLGEKDANWKTLGQLPRPLGYGACVSVPEGVLCLGGNDAEHIYDTVFLMKVDGESIVVDESLPPLPQPLCYSTAAMIGTHVYVVGGQTGPGLETAQKNVWRMDWSRRGDKEACRWEALETWPGEPRAFSCLAEQNGLLFMMGGRHLDENGDTEFLADVYDFNPSTGTWRVRTKMPTTLAAGTCSAMGKDQIFLLSGADGSLFEKADELKDDHPGFPKTVWVYNTDLDKWTEAGGMPQNQVTTHAVKQGDSVFLASGEIRPRVRTPKVWKISMNQ